MSPVLPALKAMKYSYRHLAVGGDLPKPEPEDYRNYAILQFLLVVAHYTSSIMIIYSDDNDKFTVPWKFQWNSWSPFNATAGSSACSAGCLIGEESYIFTGDERLNVSFIVAAFGLISGSNHLLQLLLYLYKEKKFGTLFERNIIAIIRNVDFAFSAPLMLICNCILFYAPPEAQFLLTVFGFQALVQLAGAACEMIKQMEFGTTARTSLAMPIFYSAIAFYVLPWAYQITVLYYGGAISNKLATGFNGTVSAVINYPQALNSVSAALQKAPAVISTIIACTNETIPATLDCLPYSEILAAVTSGTDIQSDALSTLFGLSGPAPVSPEPAPLQVYFFLGWLFVSFGLFPIALFCKLHEKPNDDKETVNFKYEIVYSVLSFLSKLPLQYFFFLGSFQRERFAPVTDTDYVPPEDGDFGDRVLENAVIPASVCTVLGLITIAVFRDKFEITQSFDFDKVKSILVSQLAALAFAFAVFIPLFIVMGQSRDSALNPLIGLNLPSVASFAAIAVAGLVELWFSPQ